MGGERTVTRVVNVVRSCRGFCQGLFLQTAALLVVERLNSLSAAPLGLEPVRWVVLLFAVGTFVGGLLEVPTGILADVSGRKRATLLSFSAFAVTFLLFAMAALGDRVETVLALCLLGEVTYALYFSLASGSFIAWLSERLGDLRREGNLGHTLLVGQCWYHVFFLLGSLCGISAFLTGWVVACYLVAGGVCAATAVYLRFGMGEEPRRLVVRYPGPVAFAAFFRRARQAVGGNPSLMVLFLCQAVVVATVGLVSYLWPVVAAEQFPQLETRQITREWVGLTLFLGLATLLGNWAFTRHWYRRDYSRDVKPATLVAWYGGLCFLMVLPLLVLAYEIRGEQLPFVAFVALLGWHRAFPSVLTTLADTVKAGLTRSTERATVLSVGSLLEHMAGAVFMGLGALFADSGLTLWFFSGIAVLLCTLCLNHVFGREVEAGQPGWLKPVRQEVSS